MKGVREDLYKKESVLNLQIRNLYLDNNTLPRKLTSAELSQVKKLEIKRDAISLKVKDAEVLAYGGRSAKEIKAAKKINDTRGLQVDKLSKESRELKKQLKSTTNPNLKAAIKRKIKVITKERMNPSKEYQEAIKILQYN